MTSGLQYLKRFSKIFLFIFVWVLLLWQEISPQTIIVSSPITSISFQQILISSSLPKSPKHLPLPHIIIEMRQPLQVSISTSLTQPSLHPFLAHITSLFLRSVIQQFNSITSLIIWRMKPQNNRCVTAGYHCTLFTHTIAEESDE